MNRSILATCLLAAAVLPVVPANADILYDSTGAPQFFPGDVTPLSYNVGFPTDILWDDVPIYVNGTPDVFVNVTRLTFEILRDGNAPEVDIDIYWANMIPDVPILPRDGGGVTFDSPVNDPGPANFVGTVSLLENGPDLTRQFITFGNGVDTLFSTGFLDTSTADAVTTDHGSSFTFPVGSHPGHGYFYVGLKISTFDPEDPQNLWIMASNSNNLLFLWDDWQDGDPSTIDEFFLTDDPQNPTLDFPGTMSIKVEGTTNVPVPEPTGLALLGLAGLGALARRRKTA